MSSARHKLVKVLSDHMDELDIDAINNAGQALVHIACDPATYSRTGSGRLQPNMSEPQDRENFPAPSGFAVKVLQKLMRSGVDFNQPDKSGQLTVCARATKPACRR